MIDVVGHFGSRLSYATIGAQLCRALARAGRLGSVTNIEERWLDDYADFRPTGPRARGQHVVMIADAQDWLFSAYASQYDPKCIAIFSSPNTDRLDRERSAVAARAGLVLVPSTWCEQTVRRSVASYASAEPTWICRVPLGVSPRFMTVPQNRRKSERVRFLHLATDFCWPGRKGTEQLLLAWSHVQDALAGRAELLVHVPMDVYENVHYTVADLNLRDVDIVIGEDRGSTEDDLAVLYEAADVVVQPSRCEGFGMMMLAACVSQTPLITTYSTGQTDFLSEMGGWLGVATSDRLGPLLGEEGSSPVVEADVLAPVLLASACSPVLDYMREKAERNQEVAATWCWEFAMGDWLDGLERWRRTTT
jgi:glycosyltransferase involved in cell wall biosynthesis